MSSMGTMIQKWRTLYHVLHDDLEQRILDATVEEVALSGFKRLAMEDVARRAGTTRVTLYRRFGNREALIEAMAVRETQRFMDALVASAAGLDTLEEQMAETLVVGLRFMRAHPVARRAMDAEREAIIEYMEADDGRLLTMSREFLAATISASGLEHPDPEALAETFVRIFVSFLLLPGSVVPLDDEEDLRVYAHRCLAPLVSPAARCDTV